MAQIEIFQTDIALANADIIVNAANGWGYMGGKNAINGVIHGVSEHLNAATKGQMEKYCLKKARRFKNIPSFVFGTDCGKFFISAPYGLNCNLVIHAVTVRSPGSRSRIEVIKKLYHDIFKFCQDSGNNKIAVPLLGTGTGGLDKHTVYNAMIKELQGFQNVMVDIYTVSVNKG